MKNNRKESGINNKEVFLEDSESTHSTKTQLSFAFGYFVRSFLFTVFTERVFAFYENEIKLDPILILFAFVIYTIWNMFNDPLIGYISDKPNRFWNRWGRRFPWIVAMGLPYCFLIILVFAPPNISASAQPWIIFTWLIFTACLYDTMFSGWMTNYYALFPDKFRSEKDRRRIAGIGSPIGLFATALATLIPPIFIEYGDKISYLYAMIILSIISFIFFLLSLPGSREEESLITHAQEFRKQKEKQISFFKALIQAFKYKNFLAYLIAYLAFHSLITIALGSIPYIVPFILGEEADKEIFLSAGLLIGQLIGVPIWFLFMKKNGNRKLFLYGLFGAVISLIPMIFMFEIIGMVICIIILGFVLSSIYLGNQLVFSDCIDEIVITSEKREEGVFLGIRTFIVRLSIIVQAITFALTSVFTGFDPDLGTSNTDFALWGLRIQYAVVPLFIILVGGIAFWKLYDLTPEKVRKNKSKLVELNL